VRRRDPILPSVKTIDVIIDESDCELDRLSRPKERFYAHPGHHELLSRRQRLTRRQVEQEAGDRGTAREVAWLCADVPHDCSYVRHLANAYHDRIFRQLESKLASLPDVRHDVILLERARRAFPPDVERRRSRPLTCKGDVWGDVWGYPVDAFETALPAAA
jgi:hypothetical protein